MNDVDDICALATGTGGAISIIRISGSRALEIARKVWRGRGLGPENVRRMLLGRIGAEPVLAVYFAAPASYTGEDVVEFHCHGGVRPARAALALLAAAGCRSAEPGEFTFRAFVNGKLDLVQAEAVCDLISSHSDMAMHLAGRQLAGSLSSRFAEIRDQLTHCLAECESHLDFPDEELDWDDTLSSRLEAAASSVAALLGSAHAGAVLRDGVRVVLAGRPNAGKSSLLNLLLGYDRAIVTDVPGTTRDTLEEQLSLRNIPVRLTDTAGLRQGGDVIEEIGIDRSRRSIERAELVFWLLDASAEDFGAELAPLREFAVPGRRLIAVWNKIDLAPGRELPETGMATARISVRERTGIEELLDLFERAVWEAPPDEEPEVAVNARHCALLQEALALLPEAAAEVRDGSFELAAARLHGVIHLLGQVTGETADPDILENIFSRFCIGK